MESSLGENRTQQKFGFENVFRNKDSEKYLIQILKHFLKKYRTLICLGLNSVVDTPDGAVCILSMAKKGVEPSHENFSSFYSLSCNFSVYQQLHKQNMGFVRTQLGELKLQLM